MNVKVRRQFGVAALLIVVGVPGLAGAQEADSARTRRIDVVDAIPFGPLTPASRFLFGREGTLFDAQANVPIYIWSRTRAIRDGEPQSCLVSTRRKSRYVSGCTIVVTPRFAIRQLSDDAAPSAPVRTPGFNPVIEYNQYAWEPDTSRRLMHHFAWRLAHYSNGQEGCFFIESTEPQCARPTLQPGASPTVDTASGSFSTHYMEFEYNQADVRFTRATGAAAPPDLERMLWYWGVAWRWSPAFLADVGGMNDDLAEAYGRQQWTGRLAWRWRNRSPLALTYTMEGEAQYAAGRTNILGASAPGRWRGAIEGRLTSSTLYGLGVVARYDQGWDQYNVNFPRRIRGFKGSGLTFGIAIEHAREIAVSEGAARLILNRLR